jgi:hypothetical protein
MAPTAYYVLAKRMIRLEVGQHASVSSKLIRLNAAFPEVSPRIDKESRRSPKDLKYLSTH